jgi:hypothetical protein
LLTNENINFEDLNELDTSQSEEPFNMATPVENRKSQLTIIPENLLESETVSKRFKQPDQDEALMVQHQPSHMTSLVLDESSIHDQTV